jgi:hypothetical protein
VSGSGDAPSAQSRVLSVCPHACATSSGLGMITIWEGRPDDGKARMAIGSGYTEEAAWEDASNRCYAGVL